MSEYTKYFAVKGNSEQIVRDKLNQSKIVSIVDADVSDFWFDEKYKRNGKYNWVVVSAPATTGFSNGVFTYQNKFDALCEIFDDFILFFQDQNFTDWSIEVYSKKERFLVEIYQGKKLEISDKQIKILENLFNKSWSDIKPLLKIKQSYEFLNFVGIPYFEMNDQDQVPSSVVQGERFSVLGSEV